MSTRKSRENESEERLRLLRKGEVFGVVDQVVGFDRLRVRCMDGYTRMCRIRGKIRKRLWVKEGDIVVVSPWSVESKEKGDLVFRYTHTQVEQLRRRGLLGGELRGNAEKARSQEAGATGEGV